MIGAPHRRAERRWLGLAVLLGPLAGCVNPTTRIESYEAPAAAASTAPAVSAPTPDGRGHRVVRGDTLYGIAFRYGLDYRDVAAWNGIGEPYTIYPDQWLRLEPPDGPPPTTPTTPVAPPPTTNFAAQDGDPAPAHVQTAPARTEALHLPPGAEPLPPPRPGLMVSEPEPVPPPTAPGSAPTPAPSVPAASGTAPAAPGSAPVAEVPVPPAAEPDPPPAPANSPEPTASMAEPVRPDAAPTAAGAIAPAATLAALTEPAAAPAARDPGAPRAVRDGWSWPMAGRLITRFVPGDSTRGGIDIAGRAGQTVYAAADGEVVYSGTGIIGYGELIVIKHGPELLSAYGHNQRRLVQEGQRVKRGQPIAEVGRDAHRRELLHFEVRRRGRPIDPLTVLPAQP